MFNVSISRALAVYGGYVATNLAERLRKLVVIEHYLVRFALLAWFRT